MQTERWLKVESLFQSALERAPEARAEFLKEACRSDTALRDEIEVLLAKNERCDDFLEVPAFHDGLALLENPPALLENPPALKAGDRIGRYEILSHLGAGGMGEVYLARDPGLARKIAIKVLPVAFAADKERVRRLKHEGRTASALNHPNILTIHEIGETNGRTFLATEFVEGVTLRARLQKTRMSPEEAIHIVRQIASALAASHRAGVLHRDIKPENIMLRPDGYVKVLDFGVAKMLHRQEGADPVNSMTSMNTEPGRLVGSIHYMSPEQLLCHDLDSRTDLWSLGVVLYEMLAGALPFSGPTLHHVAVAILQSDPPALPTTVPLHIRTIVQGILAKDKDRRYASAQELLDELRDDLKAAKHSSFPSSLSRARLAFLHSWVPVAWIALAPAVAVLLYSIRLWFVEPERAAFFDRMLALTNTGDVVSAAISGDGRYLAFATDSGHEQGLWLRQISTQSNLFRVSSHNVTWRGITFSPDGNYLYYVVQQPSGEGELWRLPVIGGEPRSLIRDVDGSVALSPDGRHLAFLRGDPARGLTTLMLASSDGSNERQLAARKSAEGFLESTLSWSPDASAVAAAIWRPISGKRRAVIIKTSASSGEQSPLKAGAWTWVEAMQWIGGNQVILVGTRDDTAPASQVFWVSLNSDAVVTATNDAGRYSSLSVTADGNLVTVQKLQTAAIWISATAEPAKARRRTPAGSQYFGVSWADNRRILARANVAGIPQVWLMMADGDSSEVLTEGPIEQRYPRVCGNGRHIVFTSATTGSWKIWRMDGDGKNPRQLTSGSSMEGGAVCTPDGRWVIFNSDQSGKTTLWRVSMEGGAPQQLTTEVSYYPEISADGNLIACTFIDAAAAKEGAIAILPIAGGAPLRRLRGIPASSPLRWGPRRDAITFVRTINEVSNLFMRDILDGSEHQLTRFDSDQIFSFDWSRDLSRLAMIRGVETRNAVMLTQSKVTAWRKQ